jgi:hypothetical protein
MIGTSSSVVLAREPLQRSSQEEWSRGHTCVGELDSSRVLVLFRSSRSDDTTVSLHRGVIDLGRRAAQGRYERWRSEKDRRVKVSQNPHSCTSKGAAPAWHRKGFRLRRTWKSRHRTGRSEISKPIIGNFPRMWRSYRCISDGQPHRSSSEEDSCYKLFITASL